MGMLGRCVVSCRVVWRRVVLRESSVGAFLVLQESCAVVVLRYYGTSVHFFVEHSLSS